MKNFLLLLLLPAFSIAQKSNKPAGFTITGNIKGLKDSTLVFLSNPLSDNKVLATGYSKKGTFLLFGQVDQPEMYQLSFIGYPDVKEIFMSNSNMTVTGDAKLLKQVKVAGSTVQKDYEAYQSKFEPLKNKLDKLATSIRPMQPGAQRDSLINVFEQGKQNVVKIVGEFVKARPASFVSPYVLYVTSPVMSDITVLEERLNLLSNEVKETFYGQQLQAMINQTKVGLEGTQAIDFTQNDTANQPVSLSSFKGKYVLVDFWASWCGPCRNENPAVVAAYNAYKNKNFTILGVSLDQVKQKWLDAIKADNLTWTHVSDLKYWSNEVAQLYRIQGIPANMLIDPNGKIIARNLRGEQLMATLQKFIK